jgi:hypothetical protein
MLALNGSSSSPDLPEWHRSARLAWCAWVTRSLHSYTMDAPSRTPNSMKPYRNLLVRIILPLTLASAPHALAQNYPSKPIRLIEHCPPYHGVAPIRQAARHVKQGRPREP